MNQFSRLLISHTKEILREPAVLFWGIIFPILMAWGLGLAFTSRHDVTRYVGFLTLSENQEVTAFSISDKITLSRKENAKEGLYYEYKYKNPKQGDFTVRFLPCTWEKANLYLKKGKISLILEKKEGETKFHFDPANPEAQLLNLQLAGVLEKGETYFKESEKHAAMLTVPGTRYIDFLVPGLLGMGIMMSCMWGISYGIIEKRSKKLLRRMVATPMKKPYFVGTLLVARIAMNLVEGLLLIGFSYYFFGITIQGNIGALLLLFLAGNMAFSGLSVLIASRTSNPEIGTGLINAIVTPMMILSGVFFGYQNFPNWAVEVIKLLPLTMLNDGVRAIFNEGAGFHDIIVPALILLVEGTITFFIGLKLYKWY